MHRPIALNADILNSIADIMLDVKSAFQNTLRLFSATDAVSTGAYARKRRPWLGINLPRQRPPAASPTNPVLNALVCSRFRTAKSDLLFENELIDPHAQDTSGTSSGKVASEKTSANPPIENGESAPLSTADARDQARPQEHQASEKVHLNIALHHHSETEPLRGVAHGENRFMRLFAGGSSSTCSESPKSSQKSSSHHSSSSKSSVDVAAYSLRSMGAVDVLAGTDTLLLAKTVTDCIKGNGKPQKIQEDDIHEIPLATAEKDVSAASHTRDVVETKNTRAGDPNLKVADNVPEGLNEVRKEQKQKQHVDRHDWEPIRAIHDDLFKHIALTYVDPMRNLELEDCDILVRFEGGFHHVVILRVYDDTDEDYVIKVPAIGTSSRWQDGDAHNMCAEVELMQHLFKHTSIPVPEIIASDMSIKNELGAPFIMMKRLPGVPSYQLWFENHDDRNYITADCISEETEKKRVNMLRSLAQVMSELQAFSFDGIGMPDFYKTNASGEFQVDSEFRWKHSSEIDYDNLKMEQTYPYGPFTSSKDYMTTRLDALWPVNPPLEGVYYSDRLIKIGFRKILDIIHAHPTISRSIAIAATSSGSYFKESYVLRHPDLDFQNILVDSEGNVTGIIDWDGCTTVPRCTGYASLPEFLRRDWDTDYDITKVPYMSWQLDHYRQIYSDAMAEIGCPEAKFTAKSAIYRAIMDATQQGISGARDGEHIVKKILSECGNFRRMNVEQFLMLIGKDDWPQAEEYLTKGIRKLLSP